MAMMAIDVCGLTHMVETASIMLNLFWMLNHGLGSISKNRRNASSVAFTALELLVVVAVIALLAALLLPALAKHYQKSAHIGCVNNLKQIGIAFHVWESDNGDHYPETVLTNSSGGPLYTNSTDIFRYFQVMSNELAQPSLVTCPVDTKRHAPTNFTTDFNSSHISYFIGLNANEAFPQLMLAGDSHLTNGQPLNHGVMELRAGQPVGWRKDRHDGAGNIAFADGSVQQFTSSDLQNFMQKSSVTNRLLLPPDL